MSFEAILLDLDGTLLDSSSRVHPENKAALQAADAAGIKVVLATGRSVISAQPVIEELGLSTRAVVFNGAAIWCPQLERLVVERTLSDRTRRAALAHAAETGDLTVVMLAREKFALRPQSPREEEAFHGLHGLEFVEDRAELDRDYVMRVTVISDRFETSAELDREFRAAVTHPAYITHFPLSILPDHRDSPMHALDVHPPCRGKAEALRMLEEEHGIPAERVIAVGDAWNDEPMLRGAGLGVAMGSGVPELIAIADRVVDDNDSTAIADLVGEMFGVSAG